MRPALLSFYVNGCQQKKRYYSLIRAAHLASIMREQHENATYIKPYQCPFYNDHWHIGNCPPETAEYNAHMEQEAKEYVLQHPEEFPKL